MAKEKIVPVQCEMTEAHKQAHRQKLALKKIKGRSAVVEEEW